MKSMTDYLLWLLFIVLFELLKTIIINNNIRLSVSYITFINAITLARFMMRLLIDKLHLLELLTFYHIFSHIPQI